MLFKSPHSYSVVLSIVSKPFPQLDQSLLEAYRIPDLQIHQPEAKAAKGRNMPHAHLLAD